MSPNRYHRPVSPRFMKGWTKWRMRPPSAAMARNRATLFCGEAIAKNDFQARGADIAADEIFVSDASKCDTGNFQELFARDITVAIPDPVYPVYLDTNVMAGRTGIHENGRYNGIHYLEGTWENGFIPALPETPVDLIYLCYPNNPTGATIDKKSLQAWVDYARREDALILYDAAYEAFIRDDELPHSIYEMDGAKEVAVEFRSFSKNAGFTGTRCAFTVVPKEVRVFDSDGNKLNALRLLETAAHHQVQRRLLPGPEGCRSGLHR